MWTLGHLWPHFSVLIDLGKPNTLGKACSDPSPPSQEGGGPAVSSGGGVHHQGRPGGNGQRSCPRLTWHPRPSPCRADGHEVQAATLGPLGGGCGHCKGKIKKSQRACPGRVGRGFVMRLRYQKWEWLGFRTLKGHASCISHWVV